MYQEHIPYEEALALKELGYDYPSDYFYIHLPDGRHNKHPTRWYKFPENWNVHPSRITAAWKQQVFRWFREKHDIKAGVCYYPFPQMGSTNWYWQIFGIGRGARRSEGMFVTYEEAELACIREMIKIVKNGK